MPGSTGLAPGFVGQLSASEDLARLAMDSVRTYRDLSRGTAATIFQPVGCLEVASSPAGLEQAHRDVEHGRSLGIEAQVVDMDAALALAPGLVASEGAFGALFVPADGFAEPVALTETVVAAAQAQGARFEFRTPVRSLETARGRVVGVRTDAGVVPAGRVVLATGIWGQLLAGPVGLRLPFVAVQHPYVYTEELADLDEAQALPIVRYPEHAVYARRHGKRYGAGCYAHNPLPITPDRSLPTAELPFREELFGTAVARARSLVPALRDNRPGRTVNGVFALTPDELPLAGPVTALPGLWTAEASWITHAGGVAHDLARRLLGRDDLLVDPAVMDPERFQDWDIDRIRAASLVHYQGIYDTH